MKCTNKILWLAGWLLIAVPAFSAPTQTKKGIPALLMEVEAKYAEASTLVAQFAQVAQEAAVGRKKQSSGTISIKRPSKVRWETTRPDKSLLVSNGKNFWYYTPPFEEGENGQVIEQRSADVQSRLASSLLSGEFSLIHEDLPIVQKSPTEFVLTPKVGTAGTVQTAIVEINSKDKLIEKVTLLHRGGNSATISLSKIELGKKLDDQQFNFKIPPHTDRVDPSK